MIPEQPIGEDEVLYRAVRNDPRFFREDEQGNRRISSMAFNDPAKRPSVDRGTLCPNGPGDTRDRFQPGCAVLSLVAGEIRGITAVHGETGKVYGVDVEPVPLPQNPAHAEIFGRPPFDTDRIFDRIKQSLARTSSIAIPPDFLDAGKK